MMTTLKDISWNAEWLKVATWNEFKTLYTNHPAFRKTPETEREKELYLAFNFLTGKKVSSLHKKYLYL